MEKIVLFALLQEQNYWDRAFEQDTIAREQYLSHSAIRSKAILVVKGPRRAGKTVFLRQIMAQLDIDKKQILYVNLEDYRFLEDYSLTLLEEILQVYREKVNPNKPMHFFIDEIQNIPRFERFLRTLYDREKNMKIIITGSNAKLLSKEIGTLLTGRVASIEVLPFSFSEFLQYHEVPLEDRKYIALKRNQNNIKHLFERYIKDGAIPEFLDEEHPKERLIEYYEHVIYKDIVERFSIRNPRALKEIGVYLATNTAKLLSVNKTKNVHNISINTLQEYLNDLELAYLFMYLDKYSPSIKEKTTSQSKVYCVDTGLVNAIGFRFSEDLGRVLENQVFLELKRLKKETYYHREKFECDFIVREKRRVIQAIQVTKKITAHNEKREYKGLLEAMEQYGLSKGLILTEDQYEDRMIEGKKVRIRPLWFWLLNKQE